MNTNQLTDTQLAERLDDLAQEILDTDGEDQGFDALCDRYDEVSDEIESREFNRES